MSAAGGSNRADDFLGMNGKNGGASSRLPVFLLSGLSDYGQWIANSDAPLVAIGAGTGGNFLNLS
jgi:hypothetical protein